MKIIQEYQYYNDKSYQIEVSSACNNSCVMCYGQRFNEHPKKFIDVSNFNRILSVLRPTYIKLWGRGESLIHPKIESIYDTVMMINIKTSITTNLNMKINFQKLKDLRATVFVSLHSFNPETYKKITGSSIDLVLENIENLKQYNIPFLLKMIVSRHNESEIEEFKQNNDHYLISVIDLPKGRSDIEEELYPLDKNVLKKYGRYGYKKKKCVQPNIPLVLMDGSMYSCCMNEGYLGNVFDKSFSVNYDILNFMKKRGSDACKTCPIC